MSGVFTAIAATVVGGVVADRASKRAAKSATRGQERAISETEKATNLARSQAIPLFQAAQDQQQAGFQGALDVFGQTTPAQLQAFQGGNVNAQNTLRAGLDPRIAAILGGNVDLSGLQTQQTALPDFSMFQQQLPDVQSFNDILNPQPEQHQGPIVHNFQPFEPAFQPQGQQANTGNALGGTRQQGQTNPFTGIRRF
jgi:hypothetical protein